MISIKAKISLPLHDGFKIMRRSPAPVSYLPLEYWYRQWALHETHIRCKFCNITQSYVDATRSFVHGLDCPARSFSTQYPLQERHQLLKKQLALGLGLD